MIEFDISVRDGKKRIDRVKAKLPFVKELLEDLEEKYG